MTLTIKVKVSYLNQSANNAIGCGVEEINKEKFACDYSGAKQLKLCLVKKKKNLKKKS